MTQKDASKVELMVAELGDESRMLVEATSLLLRRLEYVRTQLPQEVTEMVSAVAEEEIPNECPWLRSCLM